MANRTQQMKCEVAGYLQDFRKPEGITNWSCRKVDNLMQCCGQGGQGQNFTMEPERWRCVLEKYVTPFTIVNPASESAFYFLNVTT
ncbi:hypothetical protein B7P43_G06431 [Cryptotermes secundus]|uniref:Uncharacterized protein n=1 Tax=Cryptotermes secundus TaxID=105785 RepID=A0A2J7PJY6_9NEOP|nr:hypothetical protein B7P43_G06431 [Cryptotermes secundus]